MLDALTEPAAAAILTSPDIVRARDSAPMAPAAMSPEMDPACSGPPTCPVRRSPLVESILTAPVASPTVISPEIVLHATSCAPAEHSMSAVSDETRTIDPSGATTRSRSSGWRPNPRSLPGFSGQCTIDLGHCPGGAKLLPGGVDRRLCGVATRDRGEFHRGGVAGLELDLDHACGDAKIEPGRRRCGVGRHGAPFELVS